MNLDELLNKGLQAFEQDRFDESLLFAKQIQQAFPDDAKGFHLEGLIYQTQEQWQNSIDAFSKAIKQAPYNPFFYNFRGYAYMSMGDMHNSIKDFKEAIDLEDFEPAHRNYTIWLILNDQLDEAVAYLTKRIQTNQKDAENFELMGELMMRAGMEEKAQTYFASAKALTKED